MERALGLRPLLTKLPKISPKLGNLSDHLSESLSEVTLASCYHCGLAECLGPARPGAEGPVHPRRLGRLHHGFASRTGALRRQRRPGSSEPLNAQGQRLEWMEVVQPALWLSQRLDLTLERDNELPNHLKPPTVTSWPRCGICPARGRGPASASSSSKCRLKRDSDPRAPAAVAPDRSERTPFPQ